METINQHEGENEKLKDKIKLLETENKILKDDIDTKEKLIDFYYSIIILLTRRTNRERPVVKHFSDAKTKDMNLSSFQQSSKNLIISSYTQEQTI